MSDGNYLVLLERAKTELQRKDAELQRKDTLIADLSTAIEGLADKGAFFDRVTESDAWFEFAAVAKLLNYTGLGRNNLMSLLRELKVLRWNNEPYQAYVDRGYFKVVEKDFLDAYGRTRINRKTVVSQKGVDYIRRMVDEQQR